MNPYCRSSSSTRRGAVRQQAGEHVAAVERRNRDQVEERQQQVDDQTDATELAEQPVGCADCTGTSARTTRSDRDDRLQQVADRPGRRDDHEVPAPRAAAG